VIKLRRFSRASRGSPKPWLESGDLMTVQRRCPNMNHGRRNPPVGFCPDCGEAVNREIPVQSCSEENHAKQRRARSYYCVHCGEQLIQSR